MNYAFSKTTNNVYAYALKADYDLAGTWPADAKDISDSTYQALNAAKAAGKQIVADSNGLPIAIDPPTLALSVLKQQLSDSIDNQISLLYNKFTRFAEEYRMKNMAARAFKAAGYSGTPDPWIMSFATPTGKSPKDATDIIISLADAFDAALLTLGQLRMRKYEIVAAADASTAQSVYNDVITKANQAIAGL